MNIVAGGMREAWGGGRRLGSPEKVREVKHVLVTATEGVL